MRMQRRKTVRIALTMCCIALSVGAGAIDNEKQANIVLIVSDYMGYHDIEPYGAEDIRTPSLSRLASEGITMTNFYAAAPVCGPARDATN